MKKSDFSLAGEVLDNLFHRLMPTEVSDFSRFSSSWQDLVGHETALHVIPQDVVNHVLILTADHPGWSMRIKMSQESVLKSIQAKYPDLEIKGVKIKIDPSSFKKPHPRGEEAGGDSSSASKN